MSTARRNQIAFHGNSAVFTKNYLSQQFAVVVSKIFKGRGSCLQEQTQQDEEDVRGMRLLKDDKALHTLPPDIWEHVKRKDRKLQGIEKNWECIRRSMISIAPASSHRPAMAKAGKQIESLSKDFTRWAQKLKAVVLAKHRKEWLKSRSSSILLGQSKYRDISMLWLMTSYPEELLLSRHSTQPAPFNPQRSVLQRRLSPLLLNQR